MFHNTPVKGIVKLVLSIIYFFPLSILLCPISIIFARNKYFS